MQMSMSEMQWQNFWPRGGRWNTNERQLCNDEFVSFNSSAWGSYSFRRLRRVMALSARQEKLKAYFKINVNTQNETFCVIYMRQFPREQVVWCKGWNLKWDWREQNLTKIHLLQRIPLIKLKSWHICQSWKSKRE